MALKQNSGRVEKATTVTDQYLGRERLINTTVAIVAVAVFLGTYLTLSLLPAVVVGAVLVAVLRAPILRSRGVVRLRTDAEPTAVVDAFAGATPPPLVFQWGIADEITADDGVVYSLSYLLGLSTVEMAVETETEGLSSGGYRVDMAVTVEDTPWATYTVEILPQDEGTVVEYEYAADRRFDLLSGLQRLLARGYRDEALAAQGYAALDRDERLGI